MSFYVANKIRKLNICQSLYKIVYKIIQEMQEDLTIPLLILFLNRDQNALEIPFSDL